MSTYQISSNALYSMPHAFIEIESVYTNPIFMPTRSQRIKNKLHRKWYGKKTRKNK